jgi:penicillin-binding protein 1A
MIVLMAALRQGVDINKTSYVSKKLNFIDPTYGKIDVNTDDGRPSGAPKSLFKAVVSSDNTVFQQLDLDIGPPQVTQTARDMGITSPLQSFPAEALGGTRGCCTPLEMARAYVTINSGGYRTRAVSVTKVVKADGSVDTSLGQPDKKKVFTDGQTHEAILAMEANVLGGTGTRAQLAACTAAGKTGTTSGFKDAWFNGMTPNLNTTVWVGFRKAATPMIDVPNWPGEMFGGNAPAQIWHDYMTAAVPSKDCGAFPEPKEPFVSSPFFGKYASQKSYTGPDGKPTDGTTTPGTTGNGQGNQANGGGTQYPPGQYATPPQTPGPQKPGGQKPGAQKPAPQKPAPQKPAAPTTPATPGTGAPATGGIQPTG